MSKIEPNSHCEGCGHLQDQHHSPDGGRGTYGDECGVTGCQCANFTTCAPDDDPLRCEPVIGAHYRHYKGGIYRVEMRATDEATKEPAVVYRSLKDGTVWVRSLTSWCALVHVEGVVATDGDEKKFLQHRFERVYAADAVALTDQFELVDRVRRAIACLGSSCHAGVYAPPEVVRTLGILRGETCHGE